MISARVDPYFTFTVDIIKGTWSIYQSTFPYLSYKKLVVLLQHHVTTVPRAVWCEYQIAATLALNNTHPLDEREKRHLCPSCYVHLLSILMIGVFSKKDQILQRTIFFYSARNERLQDSAGGKGETGCLNTRFPLPTLLRAGYSMKLKKKHI